jgi:hypothetical protein
MRPTKLVREGIVTQRHNLFQFLLSLLKLVPRLELQKVILSAVVAREYSGRDTGGQPWATQVSPRGRSAVHDECVG